MIYSFLVRQCVYEKLSLHKTQSPPKRGHGNLNAEFEKAPALTGALDSYYRATWTAGSRRPAAAPPAIAITTRSSINVKPAMFFIFFIPFTP